MIPHFADRYIKPFFRDEEAATTVEYALLLALIIVFGISAILGTGDAQNIIWGNSATRIQSAIAPN